MNPVIKILINCVKIVYYNTLNLLISLKEETGTSIRYLTEPRSIPKDFDDEYNKDDYIKTKDVELGWNGKYSETP
tara:strand:- start:115 stop:339 length:225 start_codon:yes stop_codon:yes gene_type:complete